MQHARNTEPRTDAATESKPIAARTQRPMRFPGIVILSLAVAITGFSITGCDNNAGSADVDNPAGQIIGGDDPNDEPSSMVQRPRPPRQDDDSPPQDDGNKNHDKDHDYPPTMGEEFRSIDGMGNNNSNPTWGSAGVAFLRIAAADYADGAASPSGAGRPSAREISNAVVDQPASIPNAAGVSDFVWQWGQFLDHDIDETPVVSPKEEFNIVVPTGDVFFDPGAEGSKVIRLDRSSYIVTAGVRQQVNEITAYIDASNVYGADVARASALRTLDGTGRLATSAGDLLPFNTAGFANAPASSPNFFLAGDIRANEQLGLTAMHTLFVREHNYWADELAADDPELTGDEIYQRARAVVAAEMQVITYNEFLPILLGPNALPPYDGYKKNVNAGIANVFAAAVYRFGHSMLSPQLLRLDETGATIAAGDIALADAFFNPQEILDNGIDPLLRGLAAQQAQEIDPHLIDDVRNFLFGPPGAGGFDLASLNIQRGRDHGVPSYNGVRIAYGLPPADSFADITPDADVQSSLAAVYATVDDVDAWVGGLAEPHMPGALVGETCYVVFRDQFRRLRDGDRFWYERYLTDELIDKLEAQTLADIIRRNTDIGDELPDDVFRVSAP